MEILSSIYTPLRQEARQIRLLHLARREEICNGKTIEEILSCTFSIVSLDDHPEYEALSYVWGDPLKEKRILINNEPVGITRNLHEALHTLQLAEKERILWVDAVCINQADDAERTTQVTQMKHIFERASRVVIHLGPTWIGCGEAFEFLEVSAHHANMHYNDNESPCVTIGGKTLGGSEELRNYISHFFDLMWWKRLWTVQEFVLAKESVFYCGPHTISEQVLLRSFYNIRIHSHLCCNNTPLARRHPISGLSNWDLLNRIDFLRLLREKNDDSFFYTLSSFRTRQAYDSRDKIFGLLGLASEAWTKYIIPDYTRDTEDVYREIVAASVETVGSLEFLSHCYVQRKLLQLPSFVPDWTADVHEGVNANYTNRIKTRIFDASNGSAAQVAFVTPSRANFQGLLFDTVACLGTAAPAKRCSAAFLQSWREFAGVAHSTDGDFSDITDAELAFGATLCGGMGSDWDDGEGILRRATVEQDWVKFKKWEAWTAANHDRSTYDNDVAQFLTAHVTAVLGRRLVRTSNGHLAIVPETTKEGDVMVILAGGTLPYVLRPCQDDGQDEEHTRSFTFIGDAYAFGIMDGEAWPDDPSELVDIPMI